jgi:hypothetical protein
VDEAHDVVAPRVEYALELRDLTGVAIELKSVRDARCM